MSPALPGVETFRRAVDPSDCDFLGHMNVSRYLQACSDGMFSLQSDLGLTRGDMESGRRLSFAVVHIESDFRAEVLAGDVVFLRSSVLAIGTKSATFRHRLYRAGDGALAFEALFKAVCLDLVARRAAPIPDEVRRGLETLIEEATDAA
ncbi:thioesterase family protein [Roseibacterium sp. SDUM158017]|uniref:acyl-CoA thioesterase n=1 Tax=Roseicyclus salinarum TaxID=3036773 RepID=UPI0024154316|nr:thioesterase family protein [Roseibacterium sp. SDUM158017]MDG4649492.1 thioesterase family protein [Roseibacterium sp. SDUM158017]